MSAGKLGLIAEIVFVFFVGISTIFVGIATFGDGTVVSIVSIWGANLLMLAVIDRALRYRGQRWSHFGLTFGIPDSALLIRTILASVPVFLVAILSFLAGAILMGILVGRSAAADMSQYSYLQGNLPLTVVALVSVYVVSAFAEEVIYRGFLITRISELVASGKFKSCVAVAFSSIVFGLVHSDWGVAGMVQATCMGVALGTSYLFCGRNLWVTIFAHAYMDTILVLQMYLSTPAVP